MKNHKHRKWIALLLVMCMCMAFDVPVSAAGLSASGTNTSYAGFFSSAWSNFWDNLFGGNSSKSDTSQGTSGDSSELTLVEDETTVEEGTELRASTYALSDETPSTRANTSTLKYFPITMYNYDETTINNATHQAEVDAALENGGISSLKQWSGMYFSEGSPGSASYTYTTDGQTVTYSPTYVEYNWRGDYSNYVNKGYYVDVNGTKYQVTALYCERYYDWGWNYNWTITYQGGSTTASGNPITLYKASTGNTGTTAKLPYADWNWWNKNRNDNKYGQYTYSGLVNSTLDSNKNISFTKPDGGIFNADSSVKSIYTNVEMPFVYENGTYTFDASQNGVYFKEDSTQDSTKAQSNGRLYFAEGQPQSNGGEYGDGSTTVWMPFNSTQNMTDKTCDYYFGMSATIPFTMTANGKINPNDNNSEDITFSFSGDDDVWVFIDGQLVLDLGGIHNRLDATINFAENTWELSENNKADYEIGDMNEAALSGTLFNADDSTGTLNQTRETFAAKQSHELTIFYLERGAGSSNCKIQFNLPMKDTVSVTKQATQSISEDGTVTPLTAAEQEKVDAMNFGFTLTKDGQPVANTNYNLLNANGQVIDTRSTNSKGHFELKNGQTARFIVEIGDTGNEYKVVEDVVDNLGFKLPTYSYSGTCAGGFEVGGKSYNSGNEIPDTKTNLTSAAVTAKGSDEAEDSLNFVCENFYDANLPNPSSRPVDDKIVVDYGLPVVIDALANDQYRGDKLELTNVEGAKYGTATIEDGKITYQLTSQLTGVEVLTYTATATGLGNDGTETTTATESRTANIYIIPATSMYYEENFGDMITFSDEWKSEGTAQTDTQEPGVVGTVGDSPYGSDAAYRNDSGDSNGSSMHVNTANASATFSYSFTGTGTSFFARTSGESATIRIVVKTEDGSKVADQTRNTIYKSVEGTDVGTLYNIPVYTVDGLDYGTYTVEVNVLKAVEILGYGSEFYLDGIRVINPLNTDDDNVNIAEDAYATDGEANMTVATLRQKLLQDSAIEGEHGLEWDGEHFVIFTDSNGNIESAEEYKSNGPKEEVYLNNGQSVTFSLADWDPDSNKIYLGIKAPTGNGKVSINGHTLNINNTTDCYYEISDYADIITGSDGVKTATFKIEATSGLISVTNIKVSGNTEFTIVNGEDIVVGGDGEDAGNDVNIENIEAESEETAAKKQTSETSDAKTEQNQNSEAAEDTAASDESAE